MVADRTRPLDHHHHHHPPPHPSLRLGAYTLQEWDRVLNTGHSASPELRTTSHGPPTRSWAAIVNTNHSSFSPSPSSSPHPHSSSQHPATSPHRPNPDSLQQHLLPAQDLTQHALSPATDTTTSPSTLNALPSPDKRAPTPHPDTLADRIRNIEAAGIATLPVPPLTPRGLLNSGNACFMNVVFQALLACDPFRAILFALEDVKIQGDTFPLLARFVRLAREVRHTQNTQNKQPTPPQNNQHYHQWSSEASNSPTCSEESHSSPASPSPHNHYQHPQHHHHHPNGQQQQHQNTHRNATKHTATPNHRASSARTNQDRRRPRRAEPLEPVLDPNPQTTTTTTTTTGPRQQQPPLRPDFMNDAMTRRRGTKGVAMSAMFSRGSQEDAQEFLTHILDELHEELLSLQSRDPDHHNAPDPDEEWEEMSRKGKTVVVRPTEFRRSCISAIFGGSLRSELKKPNEKPSVTREPFVCLQLDVEHSVIHGLEDALTKYFEPESLEGFTLESTQETVEVNKRFYFEVLPHVLILHVKRFSYNHENQTSSKVARRIDFQERLVLNPWQMASSSVAVTPDQRSYQLTAVVTHLGKELAGGHYTCDVRTATNAAQETEWMFCDDSKLEPLSLSAVLKKQAYLLFYTRIGK